MSWSGQKDAPTWGEMTVFNICMFVVVCIPFLWPIGIYWLIFGGRK